MDPNAFDRLVRGVVQPASRRRALGGLVAGGLAALFGAALGEARDRGKPDHPGKGPNPPGHGGTPPGHGGSPPGHGDPGALLRGISVLLVNPAAARSTPRIEGVETEYLGRCTLLGVINLPPGKDALFDTHDHALTLQVNRRYRFFFANVAFMRPYITVAIAGSDDLCPTRVVTVLDRTPMDEGDVVPVTVEGHRFTIRRNADKSDFKYFTLDFPLTL